jgi:cytochrome c oxidase subunit 3
MSGQPHSYYLPEPSPWPLIGSFGLFLLLGGLALLVNDVSGAPYLMGFGFVVLLVMVFGWFGTVIREGQAGRYNEQVDKSSGGG